MSSVDSRIVTMKFENSQFQKGVSSTLNALSSLKDGLAKLTGGKQLEDLNASAGKVNLTPVSDQVHGISKAFVAMSTVAITALSQITSAVGSQVGQMAKSLSGVKAMADGWSDYELKIGATQTIMAGTGLGIEKVSKYLKELDIYADQTIYSLSDMTSNIGKFTNAGVRLPVAVDALKGVAQVAALSGANSNEAARAMYNLGQAIGQGHVKLMDWKSVELANMGTKEFKEQLIQTAVEMGTLKKSSDGTITSLKGNEVNFKNFSSTLQDQWLTSKALTTTLNRYADETTKIGKKATQAATEVKTFSMMMETLAAAAGTGWTDTFEIIFGNLPEATKLWTGITDAVGGFIGRQADARNEMLQGWKDLGGRKDLIEGLKNIFEALGAVLKPIGKAFREIFPRSTGEDLAAITKSFRNFTESLIISEDASKAIGTLFKGVFAILGVGVDIVQGLVKSFFALVSQIGGTLGPAVANLVTAFGNLIEAVFGLFGFKTDLDSIFDGLIDARAKVLQPILDVIARMINAFADLVNSGAEAIPGKMSTAFAALKPILDQIAAGFEKVKSVAIDLWGSISGAFSGSDAVKKTSNDISVMGAVLEGASSVVDKVKAAWEGLKSAFSGGGDFLGNAWEAISNFFGTMKDKIVGFASDLGFEEVLALINTGFFIALYKMFTRFTKQWGDVGQSISGTFMQLTDNLQSMQTNVKADSLLKIAIALGILAAALWVLSRVDAKDLGTALGGLAAGLIVMVMVLKKLEGLVADNWKDAARSAVNMLAMSVALTALGIAMLAFAGAIKILATMDAGELTKGITAMAAILAVVVASSAILSKSGGAGQILVASAAIGVLAVALTVFAGAIKLYSSLDLGMMAEGVAKIAGAMIALGLAFRAFPKNMLLISAGLLVASVALTAIAGVIKIFGTLSVEEMVKSLIMLAGSLVIIAAALIVMSGTVSGAAAMLVFAAALTVLTPPLLALSGLSWGELAVGLAALAGVFLVVGIAGLVLGPITPIITALAIAIGILGLAALAVGAGLLLFATGLATLAAAGTAGIAVLVAAIIGIAEVMPLVAHQVGLGLIAIAKVIAKSGPALSAAMHTALSSLINTVIKLTPKLGRMMEGMIREGLRVIRSLFPDVVDTGWALLMALLRGIEKNIEDVADVTTRIAIKFMRAMAKNYPEIVDEGYKMLIKFLNGIEKAIRENDDQMIAAGEGVANAIAQGMAKGLVAAATWVPRQAYALGKAAISALKDAVDSHSPSKEAEKIGRWVGQGFVNGIVGSRSEVEAGFAKMTAVIKEQFEKQRDAVTEEEEKLKSLLNAKDKDEKAITASRRRLAEAKEMYANAKAARETWKKDLKEERTELVELSKEYDKLTVKLEEAQKALEDAIKARDDANKKITDQYNKLPDITEETTVEDYTQQLQQEALKTARFMESLNQLVAMGLDDASYQKLLDEGIGIQPFLDQLIAAGPGAVEAVDEATLNLEKAAKDLGQRASTELYQAGVDSAQGLVDGLRSQRKAIAAEMEAIANLMARQLRKDLKIKSPSRVMMEIGRYTNEGLAEGLRVYSGVVGKSATGVGDLAVDKIREAMSRVSDEMSASADLNPVVAPVLDLTQLRKDASKIGGALSAKSVVADVSYGQAASLSNAKQSANAAQAEATAAGETPSIVFEQNNYSPKALSPVEIYRNTKSQLSLAKEALNA